MLKLYYIDHKEKKKCKRVYLKRRQKVLSVVLIIELRYWNRLTVASRIRKKTGRSALHHLRLHNHCLWFSVSYGNMFKSFVNNNRCYF